MEIKKTELRAALLATNPAYCVKEALHVAAASPYSFGLSMQRWLDQQAQNADFCLPKATLRSLDEYGFDVSSIPSEPSFCGVLGLVVHDDLVGLVHPLKVEFGTQSFVDSSLCFSAQGVASLLYELASSLGPEAQRTAHQFPFQFVNQLSGFRIDGQSMHIAAAIAVFDARSLPEDRLGPTCVVVESQGLALVPVGGIEKKLKAFVREFGTGDVLVRHKLCIEATQFDEYFERIIDVGDVHELGRELVRLQAMDALRRQTILSCRVRAQAGSSVIDAGLWRQLLLSDQAQDGEYCRDLGHAAKNDVWTWCKYLNFAKEYADGGQLTLGELRLQLAWLETYRPDPVPVRFARIERALHLIERNHAGGVSQTLEQQARDLSDASLQDNPNLAVWVRLHLAVADTNRFDFQRASERLDEIDPSWTLDASLIGRYYSSRGQHSAFVGQLPDAHRNFELAMEQFAKIQDPFVQRREELQTGVYAIIAATDDLSIATDVVRDTICQRVGVGSVVELASILSFSKAFSDSYMHHALLRYIALRRDQAARDAYLASIDQWTTDWLSDHPWECIAFYRAWLLRDCGDEQWRRFLHDALTPLRADKLHPTIAFICATFAVIGSKWGEPWPQRDAIFREIAASLPELTPSIARLNEVLGTSFDEKDLLDEVIPFNFH